MLPNAGIIYVKVKFLTMQEVPRTKHFFFIKFYFINTCINTSQAVFHDKQLFTKIQLMKCSFFRNLFKRERKDEIKRIEDEGGRWRERERERERKRERESVHKVTQTAS